MIYIQLFLSFLQVGALSFGGGYAAMPLIQEQVVNLHSWLSMSEFTNLITIAEMTPGPIAVNSATFVGMQIAGILGAIIATLGCILPSCIIVTLLAYVYMKYRNMSLLQGTLASLIRIQRILIPIMSTHTFRMPISASARTITHRFWLRSFVSVMYH